MKSLVFDQTGEPTTVLEYRDQDVVLPSRGEVSVRMLASPINPSDLMYIRGIYGKNPALPQSPGFEGVGVVEGSGGGMLARFMKGKRVAVLNQAGGNWSEQVVVPAKQVIPLKDSLPVEQAATFFVNPATAWIMTQEVLKLRQGDWLLQSAAASNLGKMVVRLGKSLGFRTLNVVRRQESVEPLKSSGADAVVVFDPAHQSADELVAAVADSIGNQEIKAAIDPVGGNTGNAMIACLGYGARMLGYGTLSGQPLQFSVRELMTRNATVEGFWLGNFMKSRGLKFKLKLIRKLTEQILNGTLATDIADAFPLSSFRDAIQLAETPGTTGKTIFKISDR